MNIINMPCNTGNYSSRNGIQIKYIVMHYVGAESTAKNNGTYYHNNSNIGASAHYFVDEHNIVSSVPESAKAWHCGVDYSHGKAPYWGKCTNSNSIGIEMCCIKRNGQWQILSQTTQNAIQLVKQLMKKYNIDINHIVRHYDVCYKSCPAPWVSNNQLWIDFKHNLILNNNNKEDDDMIRYKTLEEMPKWCQVEVKELIDAGILKGKGGNEGYDVTEDMIRTLILSFRMFQAFIKTLPTNTTEINKEELFEEFKKNLKLTINVE